MIYAIFISDFKHTQRDRWLVIVAGDRLQQGFLLPKPELFYGDVLQAKFSE
jgi:hypothetical protein